MSGFVCGDLHGGISSETFGKREDDNIHKKVWTEQENLTKEDVLIPLGDFGYFWYHNEHPKYKQDLAKIKELANRNFTIAFVDGNHENHEILNSSPEVEKWNGIVNEVYPGIYRLKRGYVYEIEGKKIFVMGGARSNINQEKYNFKGKGKFKKEKKQKSWWKEEIPSEEEFEFGMEQLSKHNYKVDIILTHTCPSFILKEIYNQTGRMDITRLDDPVSLYLNEVWNLVEFDSWHFGHHHQDVVLNLEEGKFYCHYNNVPLKII